MRTVLERPGADERRAFLVPAMRIAMRCELIDPDERILAIGAAVNAERAGLAGGRSRASIPSAVIKLLKSPLIVVPRRGVYERARISSRGLLSRNATSITEPKRSRGA
jgi:hypothetical protein